MMQGGDGIVIVLVILIGTLAIALVGPSIAQSVSEQEQVEQWNELS